MKEIIDISNALTIANNLMVSLDIDKYPTITKRQFGRCWVDLRVLMSKFELLMLGDDTEHVERHAL